MLPASHASPQSIIRSENPAKHLVCLPARISARPHDPDSSNHSLCKVAMDFYRVLPKIIRKPCAINGYNLSSLGGINFGTGLGFITGVFIAMSWYEDRNIFVRILAGMVAGGAIEAAFAFELASALLFPWAAASRIIIGALIWLWLTFTCCEKTSSEGAHTCVLTLLMNDEHSLLSITVKLNKSVC